MAALNWQPTDNLEIRSITAWRSVDSEQWDNSGGAHRSPAFLPQRQFQPLQPVVPPAAPVQPGAPGGRQPAASRLHLRPLLFQRARGRRSHRRRIRTSGTRTAPPTPSTIRSRGIPPSGRSAAQPRARSESYAAYGQATWTPANLETVHLTGGLRYTRDNKDGVLFTVNNVRLELPVRVRGRPRRSVGDCRLGRDARHQPLCEILDRLPCRRRQLALTDLRVRSDRNRSTPMRSAPRRSCLITSSV